MMNSLLRKTIPALGLGSRYFSIAARRQQQWYPLVQGTYVLSFDVDHEADVHALPGALKLLRQYHIPAAFACVGKLIEAYPDIHRQIVADGHEVINHTYSHPDSAFNPARFSTLSVAAQRAEIRQCHAACERLLNYTPIGFRTPHFGREYHPQIYDVLKNLGYQYSSSTAACNGFPTLHSGVWEIPLSCSLRDPFTVFDSWSSRISPKSIFSSDTEFLAEFRQLIATVAARKLFATQYFDPAQIAPLLREVCKTLHGAPLRLCTYRELLQDMGGH